MFPILQIGPLSLQTSGLILMLALWLGLWLMERDARRAKKDPEPLYNLALTALLAGVVSGRLAYAARSPVVFLAQPLALLAPNPAMFDLAGASVAAVIISFVYAQRKKMPLWPTLDALTPTLAVLAIGIALANLASGSAYGAPTRMPWGIELYGANRHPSQVYAGIAAVAIAYLCQAKAVSSAYLPGLRFLIFVALSALATIFLETFRGDSVLLGGVVRGAQAAAWVVLVLTCWVIVRRIKEKDTNGSNIH